MPRLTLRTLLAYIDDTLEPAEARALGAKVAESPPARELIDRIKRVTRRRGLQNPVPTGEDDDVSDPNTVAEYLSDTLDSDSVKQLEETCLKSDANLAEVAAVHQILTLVLTEPVRVPPRANQRMYGLVEPPASVPNRRPSKAKAVAGAVPTRAEADEPDAHLLLGMRRYSSGSPASRVALAAAVLLAGVGLVGAVLMTLRHDPTQTPAPTPGPASAALSPGSETGPKGRPGAGGEPVVVPVVVPVPPAAPGTTTTPEKKTPEMPPVEPFPDKVPPPSAARDQVGLVETENTLVVTRPEDGPNWVRLDARGVVTSQDEVMSLPGYKADVGLDTKVRVNLWGNIPEQLGAMAVGGRVPFEARVRFHQPPAGYDADLTLLAGRVYLSARKPEGAKVRLRFAGEVWDVQLKDVKTDVMAEVVTAFVPGAPYARQGGEKPRTVARLAVTLGSADFEAPRRSRKAELPARTIVTWDSVSGQMADPKPLDPTTAAYCEKFPLEVPGPGRPPVADTNTAVTQFAGRLDDPKKVRGLIAEQLDQRLNLTAPPTNVQVAGFRLAAYAQAAVSTPGPESADGLMTLIDILDEARSGFVRPAVDDALSAWVARDPGNTARLFLVMRAKQVPEEEADLLLHLLRGYVSVEKPDPANLDQLVGFLSSPSRRVRELAQWNIINFVDPTWPAIDMALEPTDMGYAKRVADWKARMEEVKKRPKDEKKEPPPAPEKDKK